MEKIYSMMCEVSIRTACVNTTDQALSREGVCTRGQWDVYRFNEDDDIPRHAFL